MKRFIADALFILMLVSIGGYVRDRDSINEHLLIEEQVGEFEEDIVLHKAVEAKIETSDLADITENSASTLAKSGSEAIINIMHGSISLFSDLFDSFIK